MKTQRNTVLRIFFIIIYVVLGWTIVLPLIATHFIMKTSFGTRVTKNEKSIDESYYKGLIKKPISFNSSGHKMSGGFFYYEDKKPFKGLVIVSHGIGTMMYNYLNRMDNKEKSYFNVYTFEEWNNSTNQQFMKESAKS